MISIRQPVADRIGRLCESAAEDPFSYKEVGATQANLPTDYNVDRYSGVIGEGPSGFRAARAAIQGWTPFRLPWMKVIAGGAPQGGLVVAVIVHLVGLWWTNLSRVIYTIDEPRRFGFAYGTLRHHAESGEERFLVELDETTGRVTYSVLAFSRPRHILARLGYPLSRAAQRRFGTETVRAMRDEVARLDV